MQRGDAARKALKFDVVEADASHHGRKSLLIGKLRDAVWKVSIGCPRTAHQTPDPGQDAVEIKVVQLPKNGKTRMRAFEYYELAVRLEDATELAKAVLVVRQVA